jgi:hypothetical protein
MLVSICKRQQETGDTYIFREGRVLLQELDNTVGQLRVIHAQAFNLVHGKKDSCQKEFVLFFQWESKAVDDRTQNLQQFSDAVVPLCFIHELEENIVDGSSNI